MTRNSPDTTHLVSSWTSDNVEVKAHSKLFGSVDDEKTLRICQSDADSVVEEAYEEISDIFIVALYTGCEPDIDYVDPSLIPCSMTSDCKSLQSITRIGR